MNTDKRAPAWSCLALPLALLAACSSSEPPKPPPAPKAIEAPGRAAVTVTDADAGAPIVVQQTQELRVRLPLDANAVNSDQDWRIAEYDAAALESLGTVFERGYRDDNPSGAAGVSVWRFKPKAAGQSTLVFELRRPHALDAPSQVIRYQLTVR